MSRYVVVNHAEKIKKRKRIIRRIVCAVVLLVIVAVAITLRVYWKSMMPTVLDIAEVKVKSESTRAINEAILTVFDSGVQYNDLVTVEKNANNEVILLTSNSLLVNNLARNTGIITQNKINSLFEEAISIPLGTLSGIPLLNELGPNVDIEVSPIGTVECTFSSEFISAGINQTLHRIYLNVESKVDLILPTTHRVAEISTPVLLCETVIVGKVPQAYFQNGFIPGSVN